MILGVEYKVCFLFIVFIFLEGIEYNPRDVSTS